MKIVTEKKRVTMTYERLVLDDGFIFSDVGELYNLLEELKETDGYFTFILINIDEWEKKLIELGVATKNSKGSCCKGKNFNTFYSKVLTTMQKNMKGW
jgi:hypothetical protein